MRIHFQALGLLLVVFASLLRQSSPQSSSPTFSPSRTASRSATSSRSRTTSPSSTWKGLIVNTVAGGGSNLAGSSDGVGTRALFSAPTGVALAPSRDWLFVADRGNHRIRAVSTASRVVSTLAGGGATGVSAGTALNNGVGSNALFNAPWALAFSAFGNCLLVADSSKNAVRRVLLDGTTTTLAGGGASGTQAGHSNGVGTNALLTTPFAVAVSASGVAYVV